MDIPSEKRNGSIFLHPWQVRRILIHISKGYISYSFSLSLNSLKPSELDTYIANLEEDFQTWQRDLDRGPSDDFQTSTQNLLENVNELNRNLSLLDESIGLYSSMFITVY